MTYKLQFHKKALKEWAKIDSKIKEQFKKKLKERLENRKVLYTSLLNAILKSSNINKID